ncbi:40S ribosomal protein S7 [Fragariocoptes setiger]|uniref:Small ribosomal subunit protein eS7 n=1 Tax=Fragariocoptes setiger TaxID=1670756 RepID=A0ABQ7SB34_9ACAR|nr:40S ribosomal protein S7 [Fragariocoptes setiger]
MTHTDHTESTTSSDDSTNKQLSAFCREVRNLLRSKPNCMIPFSKFVPAYHNHYGRQCCVYQFGFTKLIELLEAIPHVVQIVGEGSSRYITLTHREQIKRFASDLIKVIKAQTGKRIKRSTFPLAYETLFGRQFRVQDYGASSLDELLSEVWQGTINTIPIDQHDTWFEIPRRERTDKELERTKYFIWDIIELLLTFPPTYSLQFSKFIPAYHHYYNRQCKVSVYGFTKLIDLFESISNDVVDIIDCGPGEEKIIVLNEKHIPCRNAEKIILGCCYYQEKTSPLSRLSEALFSEIKESEMLGRVMNQMSKFLNLSHEHCRELVCLYLVYQFKGTQSQLKQFFSLDKDCQSLLVEFHNYYYSERLFLLFSMKQILCHSTEDSLHPYRQLFCGFVEAVDKEDRIFLSLIKQYETLTTCELPSKSSHGPYMHDKLIANWVRQNIKEMIEILQLMIVHTRNKKLSLRQVVKLVELFSGISLQKRFSNMISSGVLIQKKELTNNLKLILFLESTTIVQALDLENLIECQLSDRDSHIMFQDGNTLEELNNLIMQPKEGSTIQAPVYLSWMVVRSWEWSEFPDTEQSAADIQKLMSMALRRNVFTHMYEGLTSSTMKQLDDTIVHNYVFDINRGLISCVLEIYDLNHVDRKSIGEFDNLLLILLDSKSASNKILDNNLNNSLGSIIVKSWDKFPLELSPFIDNIVSFSRTENHHAVLKIVRNLTSITQSFSTEIAHKTKPLYQEGFYKLLQDVTLYGDHDLLIGASTVGFLNQNNQGHRIITWSNVKLDGWLILRHILDQKTNSLSLNEIESYDAAESLQLSKVVDLCRGLLNKLRPSSCPQVMALSKSCLHYFDVLTLHRRPPRVYVAACLRLLSSQIRRKLLKASDILNKIQDRRLLPYMVGLTHKLVDITVGRDTNASTIGELIASEECIRGQYELCKAFLEFITVLLADPCHKSFEQTLLASVIYILNEIYPSHHLWSYEDASDSKAMSRLCTGVFHQILSNAGDDSSDKKSQLELVCIIGLIQTHPHLQLLSTIKNGEQIIKAAIEQTGSDIVLTVDDHVIMLRQSLSILNRLLIYNDIVGDHCNITEFTDGSNELNVHGVKVSRKQTSIPMTAIVKVLFATNSRPNLLLQLFYYIYQQYDPSLACLAIQVLKRIAKKFSLSLMACLGAEAESICDFFLSRLEGVTEDLNLKVAILDFMSTCVQYQPGLMEMFLNYSNTKPESAGCIQAVMNMLEEKKTNKYHCSKDLHAASLKFILTFWQGQHSAIATLDRMKDFWTLVTFPLVEFSPQIQSGTPSKLSNINDEKLCCYVLMILAREIFYLKGIPTDRTINPELIWIFNQFAQSQVLATYSNHLKKICHDPSRLNDADINMVLSGWRDFLVSCNKHNPFVMSSDMKLKIYLDTMSMLEDQLGMIMAIDKQRMSLVSETLFFTSHYWLSDRNVSNSAYEKFHHLLYLVDGDKDSIPFAALVTFMASFNVYLIKDDVNLKQKTNLSDLIVPTVQILEFSVQLYQKHIVASRNMLSTVESNLCLLSILCLRSIMSMACKDASLWVPFIRTNFKAELFGQILTSLLERKEDPEVCHAIFELLTTMCSISETATFVNSCNILEQIFSKISTVHETMKPSALSSGSKITWIMIYHQAMKLNIILLNKLGHECINNALAFLKIHQQRIIKTLDNVRIPSKSNDTEECLYTMRFISLIAKYRNFWERQNKQSLHAITEEMKKFSNIVVPKLLNTSMNDESSDGATVPDFENARALNRCTIIGYHRLTQADRRAGLVRACAKLAPAQQHFPLSPFNGINPPDHQSYCKLGQDCRNCLQLTKMAVPLISKIVKPKGQAVAKFENTVAQALTELEQSTDLKLQLRELQICGAKQIDASGKKAIIIWVPYPQLKAFQKIQARIVRELEKKFSGKHVVVIAKRTILPKPTRNSKTKNRQKRPRSRTLTAVHDAILEDLVYPAEIVGKRFRVKLDGSRLMKVHLDKGNQTFVEHKIGTFASVYKKLTGKELMKSLRMISKVFVFAIVFLAVIQQANSLNYSLCDQDKTLSDVVDVKINDCESTVDPCTLVRGFNKSITIDFKPKVELNNLKIKIAGKLKNLPVPFNVNPDTACGHYGLTCPLVPGQNYKFQLSLPIYRTYPKINVDIQLRLIDQGDRVAVCLVIPAKIQEPEKEST